MNMDFEEFKDTMLESFGIKINNYEDILRYISILAFDGVESRSTIEMAEKEYEKLVEENNKLWAEIGELKDKIKEG